MAIPMAFTLSISCHSLHRLIQISLFRNEVRITILSSVLCIGKLTIEIANCKPLTLAAFFHAKRRSLASKRNFMFNLIMQCWLLNLKQCVVRILKNSDPKIF
jgi:hypothetical protein